MELKTSPMRWNRWHFTVGTTKNLERRHAQSVDGIIIPVTIVGLTSSVRSSIRRGIPLKNASTLFGVSIAITVDIRHTSVFIWNRIVASGHVDG